MSKAAKHLRLLLALPMLCLGAGCTPGPPQNFAAPTVPVVFATTAVAAAPSRLPSLSPTVRKVLDNAVSLTRTTHIYDPAYVSIAYPNGDVPRERGVCTDVIVRAFRAAHVDLQKTVHEDMSAHFAAYPTLWGLHRPDPNIDHRRVANLMAYFKRQGQAVAISAKPGDYRPGDVVAWELPGGLRHIGLVSDHRVIGTNRCEMIHNIGAGTRLEDVLFAWKITGHYRCFR